MAVDLKVSIFGVNWFQVLTFLEKNEQLYWSGLEKGYIITCICYALCAVGFELSNTLYFIL